MVIWGKEDYLKEAEEQLSCKEIYEEVADDPSPIIETMHRTPGKIRKRGDIDSNTLKYFDVEEPKFGRFYLLPKIHKRLHTVPGRPAISNSGFYTENISAFLDFILNLLRQTLSHTSRILTIFLENFKTSLNFQMT